MLFSITAYSNTKSICGDDDDRTLSNNRKVARIQRSKGNVGCTFTLIGRSCGISAGHCERYFKEAHFNVPLSNINGRMIGSNPEDIYSVTSGSVTLSNRGSGNDWAVMRLNKNQFTNVWPGDEQGYYSISAEKPLIGSDISIAGYGQDKEKEKNHAQQVHEGQVLSTDVPSITHNIDTRSGNSGSSIISLINETIVGVHTHGGCSNAEGLGYNSGTMIAGNHSFNEAIKDCLSWERNNL